MNYLLQTILVKEYRFIPSEDVFQAVHMIRNNENICALIVDLDFHHQQAWDFIEHVKSSKMYRLPIIVLTTENNDTLRQKCYEYEVDEIFFKPFNPLDLIAAIKSMMTLPVIAG